MAGKKQPYGINNIVSWGATIVIIGLLFKIQHWPYGGIFISIGLGMEAFLFLILGFQREEKEIDWVRVYPELDEDFKGDLPKASVKTDNFAGTAALDKMLADAKIGPQLISSLGDGLRTFGDKVASIAKVSDAGEATLAYTNKIKQATSSYDHLNTAFEKAHSNLAEIASTNVDSKSYHEQINKMAKNLTELNSVYELELRDSGNHLKSMNKYYENLSATMASFNDSVNDSKQFKEEVGRLAKNISSLNAIYGNMLSAMNQPRS